MITLPRLRMTFLDFMKEDFDLMSHEAIELSSKLRKKGIKIAVCRTISRIEPYHTVACTVRKEVAGKQRTFTFLACNETHHKLLQTLLMDLNNTIRGKK